MSLEVHPVRVFFNKNQQNFYDPQYCVLRRFTDPKCYHLFILRKTCVYVNDENLMMLIILSKFYMVYRSYCR